MADAFPQTRHSLLESVRGDDPGRREEALGGLFALYWKPVYKYLRLRHAVAPDVAEDLTQSFFASAIERGTFAAYDPAVARFRTFLRVCVDRHALNVARSGRAERRGGSSQHVSLDVETIERDIVRAGAVEDPEAFFRREWVRSLFELAVGDLAAWCRETGKTTHLALFERYDVDPPPEGRPTYQALADEYGIPVTQVTNWLAVARREFRKRALDRLRASTGSEAEFRAEARDLFGVDPS